MRVSRSQTLMKLSMDKIKASLSALRIGPAYWALYGQLTDLESRCILITALVCAVAAGIPIPLMAVVLRGVIESFPPPEDQMKQAITYLLAISSAYFALTWAWTVTWGVVGGRISRNLQEALVEKVLGLDMAFFDTEPVDLTSILTADTQTVQRGTSEKVGLFIQSISYFVATFITGFILSPSLTGVLLAAVFPTMFILVFTGSSLISKNSRWAGRYTEHATSAAEQAIKAVQVVQAFGAMNTLGDSHARTLHHAAHYAFRKSIFSAIMLACVYFICYSANSLAFFWGAKLGGSSGTIYAVVFLILDASFVFTQVGPFIQTIATASGAGKKILDLISRPTPQIDPYSESGVSVSENLFDADITCRDVSFAYPVRINRTVLQNVSLTFKSGSSTGIVGLSGSGKSSLVGLLLRLYDTSSGSINIGATDIKKLNIQSFRSHISLVDQEPVLFSGSILDNISQGLRKSEHLNESQRRAICEQAAREANADFITQMDRGIDSLVGSSGSALSGGQKQRICLARALARKPRLLILDEPTSALDSASERKILDALRKVAQTGCTVIMIAHRLSTIKDMDNIVVMSEGRVQECGKHEELLEMDGGAYMNLVHAQNTISETRCKARTYEDETKAHHKNSYHDTSDIAQHSLPGQLPVQVPIRIPGQGPGAVSGQAIEQPEIEPPLNRTSLSLSEDGEDTLEEASSWNLLLRCVQLNSRRENVILSIGLFASAIMGVLIVYEAIVFGHLITILQSGTEVSDRIDEVKFYCLMFFVISLIALLASATSNSCFGLVSEMLLTKLRDNALRTILNQDQEFFQSPENSPHRLIAAISSDANHIAGLSGSILATIFSVIVNLVSGVTVALVFAWSIALVLMAVVPAIVLAGLLRVTMLTKFEKRHHESFKQAAALASEAVQNIRTVAAYGNEADILRKYKATILGPYKQSFWYLIFGDLALTFGYSITFFTYALAYWWGSKQVKEGHYTVLDFFTMLPAFLLTAQQSGQLFSAAPELLQARNAARRLFKLLDAKPTILKDVDTSQLVLSPPIMLDKEPYRSSASTSQQTLHASESDMPRPTSRELDVQVPEKGKQEATTGQAGSFEKHLMLAAKSPGTSITLNRVCLSYPGSLSVQVLHDVSFHVRSGSTVGLVGPSGAGKSSIISLLERFYDPTAGTLLFDGTDIRTVSAPEHRDRLSYVPQEPSLFEGTVAYNIELGAVHANSRQRPSRQEIERVCMHYRLHDFIMSLPEGYDTEVGANGNRLSGGQKQRIALARALMRFPRVLILDEATSALDAHSEQEVQRILKQVKAEGRTVIMVAHRMITVRDADNILVLEKGQIIESGKHEDLMRLGGVYEKMVRAQILS